MQLRLDQIDLRMSKHKIKAEVKELDEIYTFPSNSPERMKVFLTLDVVDMLIKWSQPSTDNRNELEDISCWRAQN